MLECLSINVDGTELISDKYYFSLDGLFESDNNVITNELFTDGESYNRTKIQAKKALLNGFIRTRNIQDFMFLRQLLCNKKLKTFTVNIPGLGLLQFQGEIENWTSGSLGSFTVSCQIKIPDPYLYAQNQQSISLGAVSNNGLTFPLVFPISFGAISGGQGIVTNQGNAIAYPIITIIGTCDTITITNVTTGESMSLNVSLGASDTLIIDNRPSTRGIYLNGIKRIDLKNGSWLSCSIGDNVFAFTRNSLESKLHCTVTLQSRWI